MVAITLSPQRAALLFASIDPMSRGAGVPTRWMSIGFLVLLASPRRGEPGTGSLLSSPCSCFLRRLHSA